MRAYQFITEEYKFKIDPMYSSYYDDNDDEQSRHLVPIRTGALDQLWKRDHGFYIGKNGEDQIKDRYQRFGKWLQDNELIEAPTVSIMNNKVSFYNGRHRFAWLRDHGHEIIPVAMDEDSIKNATRLGLIAK